jgi:hypothetical protein
MKIICVITFGKRNRQTEQESEKQCQFIYTAELCEEKDFENVSVLHLSVQNKTARVQQKNHIYLQIVMDLHDCSYWSVCYVVNINHPCL